MMVNLYLNEAYCCDIMWLRVYMPTLSPWCVSESKFFVLITFREILSLFSLLWSTSWSSIFSSSSSGSRRAGAFPATRGGVHLRQDLISRLQRARLSFCMFKVLKYFDTGRWTCVCVRHSSSIPAHKNHVKAHFHYFMWCHYLCSINVSSGASKSANGEYLVWQSYNYNIWQVPSDWSRIN